MEQAFARRLDLLFTLATKPDGTAWTYTEVTEALGESGVRISRSYLSMLRTGRRPAPRLDIIEALAGVFGVSPLFFHTDRAGVELARLLPLVVISARDRATRDLLALLPTADPARVSRALAALEAD